MNDIFTHSCKHSQRASSPCLSPSLSLCLSTHTYEQLHLHTYTHVHIHSLSLSLSLSLSFSITYSMHQPTLTLHTHTHTQVPFCGIVKNGIKGLQDAGGSESGKQALVAAASATCDATASTRRVRAVVDEQAWEAQQRATSLFARAAVEQVSFACAVSV